MKAACPHRFQEQGRFGPRATVVGLTWMFGLVGLALICACHPIPRTRTLPPAIYSVYVPMVSNRTQEPGLEEKLTRSIQQEFLADGRMKVHQRGRADAWVECTIKKFTHRTVSRTSDDYPSFSEMDLTAEVRVRENVPGRPMIGGVRVVTVRKSYPSDLRSSYSTLDMEALGELMESAGRQVVLEVLTGEYGEETFTKTGTPAEEAKEDEESGKDVRSWIK